MLYRRILGVDAGLASGAAAVYGKDGASAPRLLGVLDLPTKGEGTTKRIDVVALRRWISLMDVDFAYIEAANAMPAIPDANGFRRAMGAGTMARYMRAAGATEACVELSGVDWVPVQPRTWKAAFGLVGPNKKNSLEVIRGLCPEGAHWLKRQKDHNRAEAIGIAIYGCARSDILDLRPIGAMV